MGGEIPCDFMTLLGGGGVAARGERAAAGDAGDWLPYSSTRRALCSPPQNLRPGGGLARCCAEETFAT
jgi:hypothetical protein